MREVGSIIIIIVSIATAIGIGSTFFMDDDNPVEETCEQIIEITTGNDVDLSEDSEEDKDPLCL